MTLSYRYDSRIHTMDESGRLAIGSEYSEIASNGISKIKDLKKLKINGHLELFFGNEIINCPNLNTINFVKYPGIFFPDFADLYSLEKIFISGEQYFVKTSSSGITMFIKNKYIHGQYIIYEMNNWRNETAVFIGTTIDGYEYVGMSATNTEEAMKDLDTRIKKHIAPRLYYDYDFYGTDFQAEKLNRIVQKLKLRAKPSVGYRGFNFDIANGHEPKTNPHNLDKKVLSQIGARVSANLLYMRESDSNIKFDEMWGKLLFER